VKNNKDRHPDERRDGSLSESYLRPLSLVFGADAARAIANGTAGALGGMAYIGFTQVEVIERGKGKTIAPFNKLANTPAIQNITRPRPAFAGVSLNQSQIMGIVNVTPDSFSDGGKNFVSETAIAQGLAMIEQGAAILDIGGESTRPGSDAVSIEEERARIMPVITVLAKSHTVSVDTRKAVLMDEALCAGAKIINDVSALGYDLQSAAAIAKNHAPVILMHAQGEPRTMQLQPKYDDVALDVYDGLAALIAKAEAAGIPKSHICIDPGIGFGKTFKQNLELLQQLSLFHGLGVALLVGLSRKGFIGAITSEKTAAKRVPGSIAGALQAAMQGAHLLRVHDVKETVDALAVFNAALDPNSAAV
jgi:dihydropteroate synthase